MTEHADFWTGVSELHIRSFVEEGCFPAPCGTIALWRLGRQR